MAEPLSTGAATLIVTGVAVPALTIYGVALGLRADILLAGFLGAIAAIALLNSVPSTGDTWRELIRTTFKRVFVALASAFTAGYLTPALLDHVSLATQLASAFVVGAGAQKMLAVAIERLASKEGANRDNAP